MTHGWRWTGRERPPFAEPPGAGRESVWDYPRPPRLERDAREVVVRAAGAEVARTRRAIRVLETAGPPTFYLPLADVRRDLLGPASGSSFCEWKGEARYGSLVIDGRRFEKVAWWVPEPSPGFAEIRDHVAFYAGPLECTVAGERVRPQPGRFYGGWITADVVGPFKGEPGSESW